jgi:hypothetical protein
VLRPVFSALQWEQTFTVVPTQTAVLSAAAGTIGRMRVGRSRRSDEHASQAADGLRKAGLPEGLRRVCRIAIEPKCRMAVLGLVSCHEPPVGPRASLRAMPRPRLLHHAWDTS